MAVTDMAARSPFWCSILVSGVLMGSYGVFWGSWVMRYAEGRGVSLRPEGRGGHFFFC